MLELEKGAMANHRLPTWARKKIAEAQKRRWQKIRGTSNQPPRSPLREKLVKNIGRELQADEASFVRQVQRCFADARVRMFTENDLGMMAGRASDGYWTAVDLWREFPPDDFYFWLYVAWELRRRDWKYPQFIAGITDFQLIEPAMKQWERDKEIEQWNNRFRQFDNHAPVSETGALELRQTGTADCPPVPVASKHCIDMCMYTVVSCLCATGCDSNMASKRTNTTSRDTVLISQPPP
jgi:hypothetical protein